MALKQQMLVASCIFHQWPTRSSLGYTALAQGSSWGVPVTPGLAKASGPASEQAVLNLALLQAFSVAVSSSPWLFPSCRSWASVSHL